MRFGLGSIACAVPPADALAAPRQLLIDLHVALTELPRDCRQLLLDLLAPDTGVDAAAAGGSTRVSRLLCGMLPERLMQPVVGAAPGRVFVHAPLLRVAA